MMVTVLGLAGLAIILFAISRAPSEPADHYRMLYPEFFEDQVSYQRGEQAWCLTDRVWAPSGVRPLSRAGAELHRLRRSGECP
jgi:hypothetical protein